MIYLCLVFSVTVENGFCLVVYSILEDAQWRKTPAFKWQWPVEGNAAH